MKNFLKRANSFLIYEAKEFLWSTQRKFRKSMVIKTKQGVYKILTKDNAISRSLFVGKEFESDLISKSIHFLIEKGKVDPKGKGTLLDVGGNNGITTISMLVGNFFAHSAIIEPEPSNFKLMNENLKLNNLADKVVSFQYAVSDKSETLVFELSPDNLGDHRVRNSKDGRQTKESFSESRRETISVQSMPLPEVVSQVPPEIANKIELVWIDIQGHEGYLFRGAKEWFIKTKVPVMVEVWPYVIMRSGISAGEFFEIVSSIWNYYYILRRGRFVRYPIQTFDCFLDELGVDGSENIIFMHE